MFTYFDGNIYVDRYGFQRKQAGASEAVIPPLLLSIDILDTHLKVFLARKLHPRDRDDVSWCKYGDVVHYSVESLIAFKDVRTFLPPSRSNRQFGHPNYKLDITIH